MPQPVTEPLPVHTNRPHRIASAPIRVALMALAAFVVASVFAPEVAAQGTCACNNGCHQYPGQCVRGGGSAGCEAGFAPFCGNRSGSCPRTGWVSCSGDCSCVRIPGYDAGAPPMDAPRPADVPVSPDATQPLPDTPRPPDVTAPSDLPPPLGDAPRADGTVTLDGPPLPPNDAPAPPDGAATADVPASLPDAAPCVCPAGVCIEGRCITERCTYQQELGFVCLGANTACRVIDGDPWCVPTCLGTSCADGEFCDESSGGACMRDMCAVIRCAAGLTCMRNRCGRVGDGGAFVPDDAGVSSADGGRPMVGVDDGGCGCRTRAVSARGSWLLALGLAALGRRRYRASARK